jgi:hypothetical protein
LVRGKASRAHKPIHQALATCAREDRRPTSSNAFADSKGPQALFSFMREAAALGGYDISDAGAVRLAN